MISPTKELALQTARAMTRLCETTGLRCCCLTKATAVGTDFSKVLALMMMVMMMMMPVKSKHIAMEAGC